MSVIWSTSEDGNAKSFFPRLLIMFLYIGKLLESAFSWPEGWLCFHFVLSVTSNSCYQSSTAGPMPWSMMKLAFLPCQLLGFSYQYVTMKKKFYSSSQSWILLDLLFLFYFPFFLEWVGGCLTIWSRVWKLQLLNIFFTLKQKPQKPSMELCPATLASLLFEALIVSLLSNWTHYSLS